MNKKGIEEKIIQFKQFKQLQRINWIWENSETGVHLISVVVSPLI